MQNNEIKVGPQLPRITDKATKLVVPALAVAMILVPQLAFAQDISGGAFGQITNWLKSFVQVLIFDWGYYIAILMLAIQVWRLKTGRASFMDAATWVLGTFLIFAAPNIVAGIKNSVGSSL